jgi:hypothetical protein
MASKWGSPEILGETDLRGNMVPKSMAALSRFAIEQQAADREQAAQDARDAARNKRIDYWDRRGQASWQEPDYAGEDLAARNQTAAALQLEQAQKMGDIEGGLAETYEPGAYKRKAEGADYAASLADKRYWDPRHQSMIDNEFSRRYDLATAPATIASEGRSDVAAQTAAGKLAVEKLGLTPDVIEALAKYIKAGGYGADKFGVGLAPGSTDPGAVQGPAQQGTLDALMKILNSGGQQDRTYNSDLEAQIKDAMVQTGESRQSVIEHLKAAGIIR